MERNHESFDRIEKPKGSSDRAFGLVFFAVFTITAYLPHLSGGTTRWWALLTGGAFLLFALLCPSLLSGLNGLWTKLGLLLHKIANTMLLAVIFFVVFTPFAIFLKLFRKDALNLTHDPATESNWIRSDTAIKQRMKNQF